MADKTALPFTYSLQNFPILARVHNFLKPVLWVCQTRLGAALNKLAYICFQFGLICLYPHHQGTEKAYRFYDYDYD